MKEKVIIAVCAQTEFYEINYGISYVRKELWKKKNLEKDLWDLHPF